MATAAVDCSLVGVADEGDGATTGDTDAAGAGGANSVLTTLLELLFISPLVNGICGGCCCCAGCTTGWACCGGGTTIAVGGALVNTGC